MTAEQLSELLMGVQRGQTSIEQAIEQLSHLPFADLGFARVDHHRALRQGMAEVIFAPGKATEHLVAIARDLQQHGQNVLVTRVNEEQASALLDAFPEAVHHTRARSVLLERATLPKRDGTVLIVTAGTSDLPVAEEAQLTLHSAGVEAELLCDVGVAGLHRLLAEIARLRAADVVIVVAGMEGALASVVGGLVSAPVVGVPTSVGYGAALGGFTALFAMLTSCASGTTLVNIDNGFGAAMAAIRILDATHRVRERTPGKERTDQEKSTDRQTSTAEGTGTSK